MSKLGEKYLSDYSGFLNYFNLTTSLLLFYTFFFTQTKVKQFLLECIAKERINFPLKVMLVLFIFCGNWRKTHHPICLHHIRTKNSKRQG